MKPKLDLTRPITAAEPGQVAGADLPLVNVAESKAKQSGDEYGINGPRGFFALDQTTAEAAAKATFASATRLFERAVEGFNVLEHRAPLTGPQAERALALLGQIEKIHHDLSIPGFGSSAADAGLGKDVRELKADLAELFSSFRDRIEASPSGTEHAKARVLAEAFVRLSEGVLGPSEPSRKIGAIPALPLPEQALAVAEQAVSYYERAAVAPTHFAKVVLYGARLKSDLAKLEEIAPQDPAAKAFVKTMQGLNDRLFGAYGEAAKSFEQALALVGGKEASIEYNLATALALEGKGKKALETLEGAIADATTPAQATQLREMAAVDPAMWHLLGEPAYHALVAPVGGSKLTQQEGVRDHRDRQLHQSKAWMYHLSGVITRQDLDEEFALLREKTYADLKSGVALVWDAEGRGAIIAEQVPINGVVSDMQLATLAEGPGRWEVTIHGGDRLVFDPLALHRLLGDIKLRDHELSTPAA